MIFIFPNLSVIRYISDNIAVMHEGKIVQCGNAEAIFNHPNHTYTRKFLIAIPHIQQSA